jgi:CubicO group peptidase (beta-lactamase class C family)
VTYPAALLLLAAATDPRFEALARSLAARRTQALVIMERGRIVHEWYAPGRDAARTHGTASLAKALVGGLSLGLAMADGRIAPDDLASKYISAWRGDPLRARITIRHLATHSSGIQDANIEGVPHEKLPGWMGDFWRREPDPFSISLARAPVIFEPGTRFHYSNPGMAALAYAVTASLRGAPQDDIRTLLRERLFVPLGIGDSEWSIGYGRAYEVDGLKLWANWGGGAFTPRAAARIGEMMRLEGEKLIPRAVLRTLLAPAGAPVHGRANGELFPVSGLCWWVNSDRVWKMLPRAAFAGAGAGHQVLLVIPDRQLVVVRNGAVLDEKMPFWNAVAGHLFVPLMEALAKPAPYPPSPVFAGVRFAPESEIKRDAVDSDNWPITWCGDGHLYTAYGDGWGFEPRRPRKLSQGFARIEGEPRSFRGVNIPTESGERLGDGRNGAKASGMLCAGGTLYAWVRNTGNAQLAWSGDKGRTWRWGFRITEGFGSPSFLQFGKNCAGAPDDWLYAYSQSGPSAYESDDSVVLARAPRGRLREQAAWKFWAGEGRWSKDPRERKPVFEFPAHCRRVDAVWHAASKRYLLLVGYDHSSGWGIYDAPAPWGPWTTVFHTDEWDLEGTHGYRLPSKWIAPGGRTAWLVFSGVKPWDAFCVRRMEFDLRR